MSRKVKDKIDCKKCGASFDVELYESVNVTLDPHLKEPIMNDKLNIVQCSNCGQKHNVARPVLFHDMERKIMIQILPNSTSEERRKAREKLKSDMSRFFNVESNGYVYQAGPNGKCVKIFYLPEINRAKRENQQHDE